MKTVVATVLKVGQGKRDEVGREMAKLMAVNGDEPVDVVVMVVPPGAGEPVLDAIESEILKAQRHA